MEEDNVFELLQRYRRDRHVLLNYMLSGNLIKKVILPAGAVSLDDVDIDQVSVDYVLSCVKKGKLVCICYEFHDLGNHLLFECRRYS